MSIGLKTDLIRHYRWLRQYGLNDSHSGNVSARAGNEFWITPTGACADTLEADQLVSCSLSETPPASASLDASLHQRVYMENHRAASVVHSHGAWSLAATFNGDDFEPADFEGQYYFPRVPVLRIPYERYVDDAAALVAAALADYPIVVVRGHGVYACAETLNLAYKWTCSLEQSAQTLLLARQAGTL